MFRSIMSRKFIISLVRHGETMENRQKIMQGQLDTKLSDLGIKQAQLLAMRLQNDRFTHIFSSDLARAADTARAIVGANKSFTGELILDRRLRERGFGNLEGKLLPEYKKAADKAKVPMQDYTPDGGETIQQVTARAKDFYEELCRLMAEPLQDIKSSSTMGLGISRSTQDIKSSSSVGLDVSRRPQDIKSSSSLGLGHPRSPQDIKSSSSVALGHSRIPQDIKSSSSVALGHSRSPQDSSCSQQQTSSAAQVWMQEAERRKDEQPQPLRIDVPSCLQQPMPELIVTNGSHVSMADSHKGTTPVDLCAIEQQGSNGIPNPSVLIVSHGLLLRELKRLILSCYSEKLEGNLAREAGIICPNTGLSQFGMSVSVKGNRVETKCEHIYVINDTRHLVTSSEDLVSLAKFQGAL